MKIVILHWHGFCPSCNELSCIYADKHSYVRDDGSYDIVEWFEGYQCDNCKSHITEEEMDHIRLVEMGCPKTHSSLGSVNE